MKGVSNEVMRRKATEGYANINKHFSTFVPSNQSKPIREGEHDQMKTGGNIGTDGQTIQTCTKTAQSLQLKHNIHHQATCYFAGNETSWFFSRSRVIFIQVLLSQSSFCQEYAFLHTKTHHGRLIFYI